jgi:predicted amidohydrolase
VGKLGLAVCYDMRFPELFRVMSRQGAEMFVVPSRSPCPRAGRTGRHCCARGPSRTCAG